MIKMNLKTASLVLTCAFVAPASASIASAPGCVVDTDANTATISVTVDSASTLSSSAVIKIDGVSLSGAHTFSNSNRTISAVSGQNCDNKSTGQVTVVDGSVTHQ
jgi:hypothetical protein